MGIKRGFGDKTRIRHVYKMRKKYTKKKKYAKELPVSKQRNYYYYYIILYTSQLFYGCYYRLLGVFLNTKVQGNYI